MAKKQSIALVQLIKNEPRCSTWTIKDGFAVEHRALLRLIRKYQSEFEEFGEVITTPLHLPHIDKPVNNFWLNEEQSLYLGTLLTNNERVREFKRRLVKDYSRCRTLLQQRQNAAWQQARLEGKTARHEETDTIKEFIEYAIAQGSSSAEKYYMNITKMENQALFLVEQKYPNLREVLSEVQLGSLKVCDRVVARALKEGMERELHYKECYKLAKDRVVTFAEVVGKSLVPAAALATQ